MTPAAFAAYLDALAAIAEDATDVVGLVAFGSTAERTRVDEWSDHDFAWLTEPGAEHRYRDDLTWLPSADRIAMSVVADHGGVTVTFTDGHVLEFGIAAVDDFAGWAGDRAAVVMGDGAVQDAVAAVLARGRQAGALDAARDLRLTIAKLLIGVGRVRRGELLSGSDLIRGDAVDHLLRALLAGLPGGHGRAGILDPRRRFEAVHPPLAARITVACALPPEDGARELLAICEQVAGGWDAYPGAGVAAVRARLGWTAARSEGNSQNSP